MYYFLVFLSIFILSIGILLLENPFISFAYATTVLLDSILEKSIPDSEKQKILIRSLSKLLSKFGLFLVFLSIIIGISGLPIILYLHFKSIKFADLDTGSFYFYLSMILGSVILFVRPKKKTNKDYSKWSMLLHRMILDNYNISRSLFYLEKKFYKKKLKQENKKFVIVTGLARAGTTAFTNLLYGTNKFHSLSYNNMPFLLSVNLWRKLYNPRKNKLKERAHGDNVLFGYKTIEALEEYFFKVFLKDKFITDKTLNEHEIDNETNKEYLLYQKLIGNKMDDTIYLAKNNNLILRFRSLRELNNDMKVIMIFREPLDHAYSLLKQNNRFTEMQQEDPFVLEYMNWLCHHEFGLNHKIFDLELKYLCDQLDVKDINYWIAIWINYYSYILSFIDDNNIFLIDYNDLCNQPDQLLASLSDKLKIDLNHDNLKPFKKTNMTELKTDDEILNKAEDLYRKLLNMRVVI